MNRTVRTTQKHRITQEQREPMTTFKTRGLVLREYESGESDKRILLLCKGHGRLVVHARGARKVKSKFLAASQMLTYGDYVIVDGKHKQFLSLAQAEVIENFYPIRQDYDKLCYAQNILDVCEKTIPQNTPCDELLRLALKALQHISYNKMAPEQIVRVFLFRFFLFYGIAPEMECCSSCGDTLGTSALFGREGLFCLHCQSPEAIPLSKAAQSAIRHILTSDLKSAFLFEVEETVLDELGYAAQIYWRGHFQN